ncbi:MAG: hypothetical protein VB138_01925 [Burkholderia sp.]
MAIFKQEAVKPRGRDRNQAENFGLPVRVTSIKRAGDAIEVSGVALATTPLAPEGEEVRAIMTEANFTKQLGHNMALSFKTFEKGEDRFADSEVILTRAYEKEGQIYAYGGTVTKYVMRGEVERDYSMVPNVTVGPLKIKLVDHADGSASQLTVKSAKPGDPITVRITENNRSSLADVDAGEVVSALRQFGFDQADRIEKKMSGWKPSVIVTMTAYLPEQADLVESSTDLQADQSVMLRNESGDVHYVFPSSDEAAHAKVMEAATKFINESGRRVEAVPIMNLRVSNAKATEVAEAYAGYIETRGKVIDSAAQWKAWQKVLSEFNAFDGQFNKLHLALSSHESQRGSVNTIERTVPATNRGAETLPSYVFNAPAAEVQKEAAAAPVDVAGATPEDFATESEVGDIDINKLGVSASEPAPAPRTRGLSM